MKRLLFIAATALMLCAACSKDSIDTNYDKLILGNWMEFNASNTDDNYILTFKSDQKMGRVDAVYTPRTGYTWHQYAEFDYAVQDSLLSINGTDEYGNVFRETIQINSIAGDIANVKILLFTVNGITDPKEQGRTLLLERAPDKTSDLVGTWSGKQPGASAIEYYYDFKADNTMVYYEKNGSTWDIYKYESYHPYGEFIAWLWKETNDPSAPNVYRGYQMKQSFSKTQITCTRRILGTVTEEFIMTRAEAKDLPAVQ